MSGQFRFCPQCASPLDTGVVDEGIARLRCPVPGCGYVHWNNPVPVVAAIVEHEGQVVLARNKLWPPKMFALITGFLEKDDPHPESGVLREVEEELGLKGRIGEFVGHYPFERLNQIIIAYHVIAEGEIRLGEELAEYKRLPLEQLRPWPAATGYALRDWLKRRGINSPGDDVELRSIPNFLDIGPRLATGGHVNPSQLMAVKATGYEAVVNLLPDDSPWAMSGERDLAHRLGLQYMHLPVDWEAPTAADFARFCAAMDDLRERRVFVHCAANKRVSAFVFLYRVIRLGVPRDNAATDLHRVWTPEPQWQQFIDTQLANVGR